MVLSTDSHAGSTPRLGMTELSYERTSSGPNYLLLSLMWQSVPHDRIASFFNLPNAAARE